MLSHGGVIGAAGVSAGLPAGTLLLGPSDPANFTAAEYTLNPDDVYYYMNGYVGAVTGNAAKARFLCPSNIVSGASYATAVLWNSSGTLIAHAEINTSDGSNWYSGTFSSPPSIVQGTTYYLGLFIGGYVDVYTRVSAPSYKLLSPSGSVSYGADGSNPTPPNVAPGSDGDYGCPEICIQLLT